VGMDRTLLLPLGQPFPPSVVRMSSSRRIASFARLSWSIVLYASVAFTAYTLFLRPRTTYNAGPAYQKSNTIGETSPIDHAGRLWEPRSLPVNGDPHGATRPIHEARGVHGFLAQDWTLPDDYSHEQEHRSTTLLNNISFLTPSERFLLHKAFAGCLRPSEIVPFHFRRQGTFDDEDITITTLITENRFPVFARLVEKYQGRDCLYPLTLQSLILSHFRPHIRDASCSTRAQISEKWTSSITIRVVHLFSCVRPACGRPPRAHVRPTPTECVEVRCETVRSDGERDDARCRLCALYGYPDGHCGVHRDEGTAEDKDGCACHPGVRVHECKFEVWAGRVEISIRQIGALTYICNMHALTLRCSRCSRRSTKGESTCFMPRGLPDITAPTILATMRPSLGMARSTRSRSISLLTSRT
jgi:hypothetical protein